MDTFICGTCQAAFNEIEVFMRHKQEGCETQQPEVIQLHVNGSGEITEYTDGSGDGTTTLNLLSDSIDQSLGGGQDGLEENTPTYIILNEGQSLVTSSLGDKTAGLNIRGIETQVIMDQGQLQTPQPEVKTKRKGRPRKGEEKNKIPDAVPKEQGRPPLPEKSKDGKYHCVRCKRAFNKERFFITHKCLAATDYVLISNKDIKVESGEDSEVEDAGAQEVDESEEYSAPSDLVIADENREKKISDVLVSADPDGDAFSNNTERPTDEVDDVPVFRSLEEKVAFEANLNVDLSSIDDMFKIHVIEQDLNENASSVRNISTSLSLYSCNICEKVFKTLSHMRLHCLIHTDLKPFKCFKCSYSSNSKGNLYTHMRKHTGQYYKCNKCSFNTVNKSHLLEHEATHSNVRKQCEMCKKDYNTVKSLINHIRKYHRFSAKGKVYLQSFLQGRQTRGTTVIHQCHVCNRKFKKKIDRDRHLFVHDIKDIPNIQHCQLCDYTACRRTYLEKHYLKHRVIYCCTLCEEKFVSTVRLIDHLTGIHLKENPRKWESLFEQSINNSLYLPEPAQEGNQEGKEYINLPEELCSSSGKKSELDVIDTEDNSVLKTSDMLVTHASDKGPGFDPEKDANSVKDQITDTSTDPLLESSSNEPALTSAKDPSLSSTSDSILEGSKDPSLNSNKEQSDDMSLEPEIIKDSKDGEDGKDTANEISVSPEHMDTDIATSEDVEMGDPCEDNKPGNTNDVQEVETTGESESKDMDVDQNKTVDDQQMDVENQVALDDKQPLDDVHEDKEDGDIMEEQDEEHSADSQADKQKTIISVVKRLGYREMTMDIFHKMRETFGSEECEYCGRLFYSKQDYEPHLRTHTGDKPFNCETCNYRAISRENLKRHTEKDHLKVTFSCKECDYTSTSRTQLWNHQIKHMGPTGVECNQCELKFDSVKKLRNHMILTHPNADRAYVDSLTGVTHRLQGKMGRRSYKCPYCDRVFIRANSELQKHIWVHEGIKPYKCPLCPYACRSKTNLQAHMLRHSNEKPFACGDCGKAYKSKTALRWHVRSHKEGKFKCDKCPYEATQSSHLKRHMETHDIVKKYVCQYCSYSANTQGYMKIHYTRNHRGMPFVEKTATGEENVTSGDSQVYKCLSCDYLFGNMSDLKRHLKVRHHVQMQNINCMEQVQVSEVQVVQCADGTVVEQIEQTSSSDKVEEVTQEALQIQPADGQGLDEKTASAVNLLQQIIDMSQQGAFGQQQQITVQAENGQMVAVNPETIIVQDGEEVLLTEADSSVESGQYVIQYVSPDMQLDTIPLEIQTLEEQPTT